MPNRYRCTSVECLVAHLHRHGIPRGVVLDAFRYIPRTAFVPEGEKKHAWEDRPLPIGEGQTISQPYTVAYMLLHVEVGAGERVLEVGTGSGYAAALLGYIVGDPHLVTTTEVRKELVSSARDNLSHVGMGRISVLHRDGKEGYPRRAPFDRIIVSAQAEEIPIPLIDQLAMNGMLIMPTGTDDTAVMTTVRKTPRGTEVSRLDLFQFVPLV